MLAHLGLLPHASAADWNLCATRKSFCPTFPDCPVHDAKNSLPLPDVGLLKTNSNKGREMAGQAAKITFDGKAPRYPQSDCGLVNGRGSNCPQGEDHSDGFRSEKQLGDREGTWARSSLRREVEAALATFI